MLTTTCNISEYCRSYIQLLLVTVMCTCCTCDTVSTKPEGYRPGSVPLHTSTCNINEYCRSRIPGYCNVYLLHLWHCQYKGGELPQHSSSTHPSTDDQVSTHRIDCRDSSSHLFLMFPSHCRTQTCPRQRSETESLIPSPCLWWVVGPHKKSLDPQTPFVPFNVSTGGDDQRSSLQIYKTGVIGGPIRDCLLWIEKARTKDETYIWGSVWWKTKNKTWEIYTSRIHWVVLVTGNT